MGLYLVQPYIGELRSTGDFLVPRCLPSALFTNNYCANCAVLNFRHEQNVNKSKSKLFVDCSMGLGGFTAFLDLSIGYSLQTTNFSGKSTKFPKTSYSS